MVGIFFPWKLLQILRILPICHANQDPKCVNRASNKVHLVECIQSGPLDFGRLGSTLLQNRISIWRECKDFEKKDSPNEALPTRHERWDPIRKVFDTDVWSWLIGFGQRDCRKNEGLQSLQAGKTLERVEFQGSSMRCELRRVPLVIYIHGSPSNSSGDELDDSKYNACVFAAYIQWTRDVEDDIIDWVDDQCDRHKLKDWNPDRLLELVWWCILGEGRMAADAKPP